jgi:secreted trypsin-like serine protease
VVTFVLLFAFCSQSAMATSSRHDAALADSESLAPYIIGGTESSISQFPWQVLVVGLHESGSEILEASCGGSILDPTHILTAAHCVDHDGTTTPYEADEFVVLAGASDVQEFKEDLFFKAIEPPPGAQAALV